MILIETSIDQHGRTYLIEITGSQEDLLMLSNSLLEAMFDGSSACKILDTDGNTVCHIESTRNGEFD